MKVPDPWIGYAIAMEDGGHVTVMARAKGYLMVRRPHKLPFVMSEKEAERLTVADKARGSLLTPREPEVVL